MILHLAIPKVQSKHLVILCGIGSLGLGVGLTYIFGKKLAYYMWSLRLKKFLKVKKKISIIASKEQWKNNTEFYRKATAINAVGFDCEWAKTDGNRRPVALLQLASYSGDCALIRLNKMKSDIPLSLRNLLEDEKIMKVGVGPCADAQYLLEDYDIKVNGWLDLRHFALWDVDTHALRPGCGARLGLNSLAQKYLGVKLNKDWRVRGGDWETEKLTSAQLNYAADDALVGIQILLQVLSNLWAGSWHALNPQEWEKTTATALADLCSPMTNVKFDNKSLPTGAYVGGNTKHQVNIPTKPKEPRPKRMPRSTRRSPLYHNTHLQAPDGEPLCTCDPKKAHWYVEKGLGHLISEDPLVVRLNFEPAGRTTHEGPDGEFYLQERLNICVVCGKDESYIRKNIVPHEYRKYFPEIMKSHQSHDVVLLCTACHQISNIRDSHFRHKLAKEFDAPIGQSTDIKLYYDAAATAVRSAATALKKHKENIPPERVIKLETKVKEYFQTGSLTDEMIDTAAALSTNVTNEEYIPHGQKVYLHYKTVGLISLEQRWRQWFLDSMKPKYLPAKWSVSHNHTKLRRKMSRHPLDDPIREDFKIALVGTEGEIDVPFLGRQSDRKQSSFYGLNSDEDSSRENSPP